MGWLLNLLAVESRNSLKEPEDVCNPTQFEIDGGWVLEVILILYVAMILAQLCDNFLMPALEEICDRFSLPEDIAGVSILAFGGSAPELAVHMIATLEKREIGSGAIVGSAVYNLTVGFAVVALLVPRIQFIPIPPLLRDFVGYFIILVILEVIRRDEHIKLWEAILLIGYYLLFIVMLIPLGKYMRSSMKGMKGDLSPDEEAAEDVEREKLLSDNKDHPPAAHHHAIHEHHDLSKEGNAFTRAVAKTAMWLTYPFDHYLFKYTIPNAEEHPNRYLSGLMLSLVWVFLSSFAMMTLVERIGCALELDEGVGGLFILAIGASLPDTIAMGIAAKRGHGGMAVAGLLGSNIFDIGVGLGLPWLVDNIIENRAVKQSNKKVGASIIFLFAAALALLLSFLITRFHLRPATAILPMLVYLTYAGLEIFDSL